MDFKKVLMGLLSTAYKMDSETIEALFGGQDEAALIQTLLEKDKDRVTSLTNKPGQTFQDGYAKAKKEVLTAFENELRSEFGVQADVTGLDLVREVIKIKAPAGGGTLTDDEVKRHPVYQSLESRLTTQLNEKEAEWRTKYDTREVELTKAERLTKAKTLILETLDSMKPVLSTNPVVAQTHRQNFANEFNGYDFDFQENGRLVITKNGTVLEDAHGNTMKLEDLVKQKAPSYFEFQKNKGAGNAGNDNNDNQPGNGDYPANVTKPTNFTELSKILNDTSIPAKDRNIVLAVWEKENP